MRILALILACAATAACQTPSSPAPDDPAASTTPAAAPVPEVKVEGPPPGSAAARSQAQALLKHAAEQLNEGNEEAARDGILHALALDPNNRTGLCLQRGLAADPMTSLGRDSTTYTVRPGDTLGSIAQRALGESCEFYLLARYNQIRVPSRLYVGQVLKIPGKVALTSPERSAKPADPIVPEVTKPAAPSEAVAPPPPAAPRAVRTTEVKAQIERHQRAAIAAFRRQDLATAITEWERVLELDPTNDLARARRQEAIELQRRLNRVE